MNTAITGAEVHLWQFSLSGNPAQADAFFDTLSEDEQSRAARFLFPKDHARFVMARGSLRLILASYLSQTPHKIRFHYGPNGKPELETSRFEPSFHFNLSHSDEVGFCAVARGEVGADVEKIRSEALDNMGIAERYFTPSGADRIRSAPDEMRVDVFFRLWTRKEAFLKASGEGLSESLSKFEVSLEDSKIRFVDESEAELRNWSVHEFRPCSGYVAAVAIGGCLPRFKFLTMDCARGTHQVTARSVSAFPAAV